MRDDVADVVAAIELGRYGGLMPNLDWTTTIADPGDPLGNADRPRQSAITQATQFAIDQMIGDQAGIRFLVTDNRHGLYSQSMRLPYRQLHDALPVLPVPPRDRSNGRTLPRPSRPLR